MSIEPHFDTNALIDMLYQKAEYEAESRRIAEYGPGGGNPDAKASDHVEYLAAKELERLCGIHEQKITTTTNTCFWEKPINNMYKTSCEQQFYFNYTQPLGYIVRYCPHCGKRISRDCDFDKTDRIYGKEKDL